MKIISYINPQGETVSFLGHDSEARHYSFSSRDEENKFRAYWYCNVKPSLFDNFKGIYK